MRSLLVATMLISLVATATAQEIRGTWVSRFIWTSETPATAQANIQSALDGMVTGHFNTCFMQLRGQCDTLYPSPYEPWSPLISSPDGTDPGWDPAQYSVSQAHSRGLKIHAYFNTHVIWQGATAPSSTYYPNHIYYLHGNPADAAHRDWVLYDDVGAPAPFNEYTWMNPGIPDADAYVRQQAIYLISSYDFDGLHFDRCRMSEAGYGKNPIAVARWDNPGTPTPNDGPGNPDNLGWDDYMRDCVTRQIMNICGECWSIKRLMPLSSAPLGLWASSAYPGYSTGFYYGYVRGQDAKAWMTMGAQDFIVPQIYWNNADPVPNFNEVMDDWLAAANAAGRYLVPGSNMSNGVSEVEAHALYARNQGCAGHNIWHSGNASFSTWSTSGHVYASAAPATPTYPWRDTEGVIYGRVYTDATGTTPVTDSWINRSGSTWTALSSGDGFYCFLRVPAGTYTLTCVHPTLGTLTQPNVVVTAGQATNVDWPTAGSIPNAPSDLTADGFDTTVSLSWTDNSDDETTFDVLRSTVSGGPYSPAGSTAADVTSYTDTPGASGTYYYVVRANAGGVYSAYSNQASATLYATGGPTNLVASVVPGQTTVTLTWQDNASNETAFSVYRSTDAAGPYTLIATLGANVTSYVDDAVLYATDGAWMGAFHYYVSVTKPDGPARDTDVATAALPDVPDLLLESRSWSGGAGSRYADVQVNTGAWGNTTAKSLATNPSVRGTGGRYTGDNSLNNYAYFTPYISVEANYEVLVTAPNATNGPRDDSLNTSIDVRSSAGVIETRTFYNSKNNPDLTDKWMRLSPPLIAAFPVGTGQTIRLTNNDPGSSSLSKRFDVDAILLRYSGAVPVAVSEWTLE